MAALGLFRQHINGSSRHLFFIFNSKYSTPANDPTHFLINYLVNTLGFSKQEAISTNTKVIKQFKSTNNNPQLVLNYLENTGLNKTHISKIVNSVPSLLTCDVNKTLKPKLGILHDVGLCGPHIVDVITKGISIFRNIDVSEMKSCISLLRKILVLDVYVVKVVKKKPSLLSLKACERLKTNMLYLQSIGFSDREIRKFLVQNPYALLASPESVEEKVERLGKDFGIIRGSGMFIYGLDVLVSLRESTVDAKIGIFKEFGWSKWETVKLVQLLPYCLRLSEKRLRGALKYYMGELGLKPGYLASHPTLLMFSMKERVLPRLEFMRWLVERKLYNAEYNMYTVLLPSETKFREVYVLPYKDKMPDVCELYNKIQQRGKAKK